MTHRQTTKDNYYTIVPRSWSVYSVFKAKAKIFRTNPRNAQKLELHGNYDKDRTMHTFLELNKADINKPQQNKEQTHGNS